MITKAVVSLAIACKEQALKPESVAWGWTVVDAQPVKLLKHDEREPGWRGRHSMKVVRGAMEQTEEECQF